jgi:ribosomal protein S18 acetylase RimI-like enzyme
MSDTVNDSIRIGEARMQDKRKFFHLWKAFMQINEKQGSDILATDQSLRVYEAIFDAYVSGRVPGVALIAYDGKQACGALLNGAPLWESPFDTADGPHSQGWGTYVEKSHYRQGVGVKMCDLAAKLLKRKGMVEVRDMTLIDNQAGVALLDAIGSKPVQYMYVLRLDDGRES